MIKNSPENPLPAPGNREVSNFLSGTILPTDEAFHLGRLARFLRLAQIDHPDFRQERRLARRSVVSAYGDCVNLGIEDKASILIEHVRGSERINRNS